MRTTPQSLSPNGRAESWAARVALGRQPGSRTRRRLLFALKLAVTLGLCGWIVIYVDWAHFWGTLRASEFWVIPLVLLMRFGGISISAVKWQRLLAVQGLQYELRRLVRWYLVAVFFNQCLPTSIGGDGYRIYKTLDNSRARSCAVLAVLLERATGLTALVLLGYAAAIVTFVRTGHPIAGAVVTIVSLGLGVCIIGLWGLLRFRLLQRLASSRFWRKPIEMLLILAGDFRRHPRENVLVGLISFVFHVNKICVIWLLLYALGTTANILELAVAVVAVEVIGLLPITLGGLGLMEGSFIYVMGHFGVIHETGLAAMLLWRVLLLPFSLSGALLYFTGEGVPEAARPAAEHATASEYVGGGAQ